jgi:drug/metabolite transporter (DMT)-like permease
MVLSMALFIINDALVKFVSQSLPSGVLIMVRGAIATTFVLVAVRWTGTPLHRHHLFSRPVLLRAAVDGLATFAYLLSLFQLPLANATAINMASPLVLSLLAWLWLGEKVVPRQWAAIVAGFAGVLLVIQPRTDGFNAFAWLCLLGTVLHAVRDILVRRIDASVPSLVVTLATAAMVTLMALVLCLLQGWQTPSPTQFATLTAAAAFLAGGYHFVIMSTRLGDLSVVAPFRYSGLLMALVLGWAVWGDVPNALAWLGIAAVAASGLVLLRRQRLLANAAAAPPSD